jgi:NAD(P)-dependent dehydrogenase (short-subunit alcohol dehydrogenase family)
LTTLYLLVMATEGSVAVVTGAASGIGLATIHRLARMGFHTVAIDRDLTALEDLMPALAGGGHRYLVVDVTNTAEVAAAFSDITVVEGRIDFLFLSAGIAHSGNWEAIGLERNLAMVDINVGGVLRCLDAAFPLLRGTPSSAVVIMASASAMTGVPSFATYAATKHAVAALAEALAVEWKRHDIDVFDVWVSFVDTPMGRSVSGSPSATRLGVKIAPDRVAETVVSVVAPARRPVHLLVGWDLKVASGVTRRLPVRVNQRIAHWIHRYPRRPDTTR